MINKLVLLVIWLMFFFITGIVNAGVVPGTIRESDPQSVTQTCDSKSWTYNTSVTCNEDSANGCKITVFWEDDSCSCKTYVQTCTWTGTWKVCKDTTTCDVHDECLHCDKDKANPIFTASKYWDYISISKQDDINDILTDSSLSDLEKNLELSKLWCTSKPGFVDIECGGYNAWSYSAPAWYTSLDPWLSCSVKCVWTLHTPATSNKFEYCDTPWLWEYYYTIPWESGTCECTKTDNMISSFKQNGEVNRFFTWGNWTTCQLEWRYATTDITWPSINFDIKGSFLLDSTKWCNLDHFKNWLNVWSCGAYDKIPGWNLVEEFTFTVQDISALSEVFVEFGTCAWKYDFSSLTVPDLIADLYNPSGVQTTYKDLVTFKSHTHSTYGWVTLPSLLSAFWKSSLDECLDEWENFLRVVAKDAARLAANINTIDANTSEYSSFASGYAIRIDNSGADISINTTSNDPDKWYNHTITWNFWIKDDHKSTIPVCTNYVKTWVGTCPWPLHAHFHWVAPIGVHHATWKYDIYSCDGVEITSSNQCKQWCNPWYIQSWGACVPKEYDWDFSGGYSTCTGGKQFKEVQCEKSSNGFKVAISACDYPSFAAKVLPTETVTLSSTNDSYYIQRSCP